MTRMGHNGKPRRSQESTIDDMEQSDYDNGMVDDTKDGMEKDDGMTNGMVDVQRVRDPKLRQCQPDLKMPKNGLDVVMESGGGRGNRRRRRILRRGTGLSISRGVHHPKQVQNASIFIK